MINHYCHQPVNQQNMRHISIIVESWDGLRYSRIILAIISQKFQTCQYTKHLQLRSNLCIPETQKVYTRTLQVTRKDFFSYGIQGDLGQRLYPKKKKRIWSFYHFKFYDRDFNSVHLHSEISCHCATSSTILEITMTMVLLKFLNTWPMDPYHNWETWPQKLPSCKSMWHGTKYIPKSHQDFYLKDQYA